MKKALVAACLVLGAVALVAAAQPPARDLSEADAWPALDEGQVAAVRPVALLGAPQGPAQPAPVDTPGVAGPVKVVASWYGEAFYGRRTACGQTYSGELLGVAHRTLPCGTRVTLRYGGATVTLPVVDRGPFRTGREFDLTVAARSALGCPDLCRLTWIR